MGYSRNELGEYGEDGVLRRADGTEVPVGLDEVAKADLVRLTQPPKIRTAPSERDIFLAAGGTLAEHDYAIEDSTFSGGREDIEKQEAASKKSSK